MVAHWNFNHTVFIDSSGIFLHLAAILAYKGVVYELDTGLPLLVTIVSGYKEPSIRVEHSQVLTRLLCAIHRVAVEHYLTTELRCSVIHICCVILDDSLLAVTKYVTYHSAEPSHMIVRRKAIRVYAQGISLDLCRDFRVLTVLVLHEYLALVYVNWGITIRQAHCYPNAALQRRVRAVEYPAEALNVTLVVYFGIAFTALHYCGEGYPCPAFLALRSGDVGTSQAYLSAYAKQVGYFHLRSTSGAYREVACSRVEVLHSRVFVTRSDIGYTCKQPAYSSFYPRSSFFGVVVQITTVRVGSMYSFQFTAEVLFSRLVIGDEYPAEVFPALVSDVIVHLNDDAVLTLGQLYRVFNVINLIAIDVELDLPYT